MNNKRSKKFPIPPITALSKKKDLHGRGNTCVRMKDRNEAQPICRLVMNYEKNICHQISSRINNHT